MFKFRLKSAIEKERQRELDSVKNLLVDRILDQANNIRYAQNDYHRTSDHEELTAIKLSAEALESLINSYAILNDIL